jgi:hypothetical protein
MSLGERRPTRFAGRAGGAWVGRAEERGAAVVEFVVVFLTLLVPLVYAIVVMADVQRAMLATSSAAREVGRVYVTAGDRPTAAGRVGRAFAEVLGSFGLRPGQGRDRLVLDASCPAGPAGCVDGFGPGAEVRVVVTWRVAVARLPFLVRSPGRVSRSGRRIAPVRTGSGGSGHERWLSRADGGVASGFWDRGGGRRLVGGASWAGVGVLSGGRPRGSCGWCRVMRAGGGSLAGRVGWGGVRTARC